MNYIEINTELTGKIIGFTQTISKQHIFDNNLTIDEVLVSEKYCDNPTVTVYPVRTGKILKCYVTANSSSYQIYSVLIFDVVRFVFSNDLIFLPNPPIVVGDEYMWDSKNYTVAKIYSHKLLIEREDDVQLITHRFKPKITKDEQLTPEIVKYIARMLREKGHDSQLLTFIDMVNTYQQVDQNNE